MICGAKESLTNIYTYTVCVFKITHVCGTASMMVPDFT